MKKIFLLSVLLLCCIGVNAQGPQVGDIVDLGGGVRGRWLGDARNLGGSFRPDVNPEDVGQIKGVIKSISGQPIKEAQVVIGGQFFNRSSKSKKDGSFSIGAMEGMYSFDIIAPGYKRLSLFLVIKSQQTQNLDFTLEPDVEGAEQMNGKGNTVLCTDAGYTMKVASLHPAYKDKTLWYLLENSPMVSISSNGIEVGESSVQIFFNGRESRAPIASLKAFCESIKIKDVMVVKVRKNNMANANMQNLIYITYKE